jgi:glutaconate CoA-transferase subunit B
MGVHRRRDNARCILRPQAHALEVMAVVLARELRDGELVVAGGVRSAVPTAAAFLAQRSHAPNLTVILGVGIVNPRPIRIWRAAADERYAEDCEAFIDLDEIFDLTESGAVDVAFYGGMQIDRLGNANLTTIISGGTRIRGPGVANAALALTARRVFLYSEQHGPRIFVGDVDVITIPGHLEGGAISGRHDGAGPQLCVTPLGVFDFPLPDRTLTARSLMPGVALADVDAATGFAVGHGSREPPTLELPSVDELDLLRMLDLDGLLRPDDSEGRTGGFRPNR